MVFTPVLSNENRQIASLGRCGQTCSSPRPPGGYLMDQCSAARHPISATGDLTNRPGHDLAVGIDTRSRLTKCSPAGGSVISVPPRRAATQSMAHRPIPIRLMRGSKWAPSAAHAGTSVIDSVCGVRAAAGRCWRRRQRRPTPIRGGAPARRHRRGCHRATGGLRCVPARRHHHDVVGGRSGRRRDTR